jgi:hypothetical protein
MSATGLRAIRGVSLIGAVAIGSAIAATFVGQLARDLSANRMAPWIIGRSSGICAYVLLVVLVLSGLRLAAPRRRSRPRVVSRLRLHAALAAATGIFTVLHVVVLATDPYAGVGLAGALLPFGANYRPVAVTMGVLGLWTGLAAGLSAAFAGRLGARVWWPIHKVAALALVAAWLHGVFAGSDTVVLRWGYVGTGAVVAFAAWWRYSARRPAEEVDGDPVPRPRQPVRAVRG